MYYNIGLIYVYIQYTYIISEAVGRDRRSRARDFVATFSSK